MTIENESIVITPKQDNEDTMEKSGNCFINGVITSIRYAIMGLFVIFIVSFVILFVLYLFGNEIYIVRSGSMEPSIKTGSVCFVNTKASYDDIAVGDIIAFKHGDAMVTHRVYAVTNDGIITKGDANEVTDLGVITKDNYCGNNWLSIPYAGYVFQFMQTMHGKIVCISIFICLVLVLILTGKIRNRN